MVIASKVIGSGGLGEVIDCQLDIASSIAKRSNFCLIQEFKDVEYSENVVDLGPYWHTISKCHLVVRVAIPPSDPCGGKGCLFTVTCCDDPAFLYSSQLMVTLVRIDDLTENSRHSLPVITPHQRYVRLGVQAPSPISSVTLSAWFVPGES